MTGILVDTSIIIDHLRQKDKRRTILVRVGRKQSKLFASIITHTELFSGKDIWEKKEAKEALKTILSDIQIVPLKEDISQKAGEIRARYDINIADAIIAATAIHYNLELVTLNKKDFEKIELLDMISSK